VLLLVLHHIYVLEHNRLCDELKRHYPSGLSEGPWNDENLFLAARTILAGKNNMVASAYFGAYFTDYLEKGGDPLVIFRSYMGKGPLQINPFKVYPWKDVLNPENNAPFALPVDFSVGYRWHDLLVKEKKKGGLLYFCIDALPFSRERFSFGTWRTKQLEWPMSRRLLFRRKHLTSTACLRWLLALL
jgi:hypothetical protein